MTDEEALEALKFISASWSQFSVAAGPEIVRAFRCHFFEVPFEAVIMAVVYLGRTKETPYPPSWAEIWKALRELRVSTTADEAFDEMVRISSRLGYDRGRHRVNRKPWSKVGNRFFKELCFCEDKYIGLLRERFKESFSLDRKQEIAKEVQAVIGTLDTIKSLEFSNHKKMLDLHAKAVGKDGERK